LDNAHEPQPEIKPGSSKRWSSKLALASLVLLGLGGLWLGFGRSDAATARAPVPSDVTPQVDPDSRPGSDTTTNESGQPRKSPSAGPTASEREQHERHPTTDEHVRIHNDNQMLSALNDATDIKSVARLRQLVEAWNRSHHQDPEKFGEAYTVIADCLEFPGEASRQKAQTFYDENRASTLRRHIRRHCALRDLSIGSPAPAPLE
jgi:hypothetical protein